MIFKPSSSDGAAALPSNIEAECAVLGSCLIDPDAFSRVSDVLKPADFYRERNGWLWETFLRLAQRRMPTADYVLVVDDLEARGLLQEIGGPAYIMELISATPTSMHVEHYAGVVKSLSSRRGMISAAGEIASLAWNTPDDMPLDELYGRASHIVDATLPDVGADRIISLGDALRLAIDKADAAARGEAYRSAIRTGFKLLDHVLSGGYYPGDLVIIAGRPAMGKSAIAVAEAYRAAKAGKRVLFFSMEMLPEQIALRVAAMETGIDSNLIQQGALNEEQWTLLLEAAQQLDGLPIRFCFASALTPGAVRAICKRERMRHGLDIVFIDYIQLMSASSGGYSPNENRQQEVSYISRQLKGLALELNVPIIALAQLSRAVESRSDKRPMLSDLRESGSLEQDADKVLFLYREDYYREDTDRQNIVDVIISKHRSGGTGTVSLYYRKETTQFFDMTQVELEEVLNNVNMVV